MLFKDIPIRRKLMTAMLLTSGVALLLTCASFVTYEILTLRKGMVDGYTTRAKIIADNSTASLAFQDQADAAGALAVLRTDKRIRAACIYDEKGKVFAQYPPDAPPGVFPAAAGESGYRGGHLDIFAPVVEDGRNLGTVYLQSNLTSLTDRYQAYAWLSAAIIIGSLFAAYLLARLLQRQISLPILALADTARAISSRRDFTVRAQKFGADELGSLTDAFNQMLEEILAHQAQLQQTELRLSTVVQNAPLILFNLDSKGVIKLSIGKGLEAVGLKPGGSLGKSVFDIYPSDSSIPEKVRKALEGEEAHGLIHVNGFAMEALYKPVKDAKGKVTEVVGVAIDVTARQKAEESLRASEANYREIFDKANDAIYIHEVETGKILDVNQRIHELIGYTREEVLASDPSLFITGEPGFTLQDSSAWMKKAAVEGPQLFEWQARHKDQRVVWLEVNLKRAAIAGQDRLLAFVRDISERKKLEEVTQSQNFMTSVLENVPNMIFVKDAKDLRFVMFNKAGEELIGVPRKDLIGKNDYDLFPKDQADFFTSKDRKTMAEGKLLDIPEEPLPTKHQGERILHTKKIPVLDSAGNPQFLLGISEDITDQKRQQELEMYTKALEVSNREMQDFVFVASHDLQEPLRKIQSFGQFLRDEFKEVLGEAGKDYVERMQSAASRMQILINDLLALTRVTTKAQPFAQVDLSKVVQEVLVDLETRIAEKKAQVLVESLPVVEADATQMRQLFQNLIANALKFQKPGVPPEIKISSAVAGGQCRILVRDNGIGFDNKYGDQIFKVFERLHGRDEYEGTGIGLAICRKVVERHHGTIKAEGVLGKGSTFTITLPVQQQKR